MKKLPDGTTPDNCDYWIVPGRVYMPPYTNAPTLDRTIYIYVTKVRSCGGSGGSDF